MFHYFVVRNYSKASLKLLFFYFKRFPKYSEKVCFEHCLVFVCVDFKAFKLGTCIHWLSLNSAAFITRLRLIILLRKEFTKCIFNPTDTLQATSCYFYLFSIFWNLEILFKKSNLVNLDGFIVSILFFPFCVCLCLSFKLFGSVS